LPERIRERVALAFKRIVFSKFGLKVVNDAGLDAYYVPHGVDTRIFRMGDRIKAREYCHLPADRFIVGMVAANKGNPSRKAFTPQLEAFAEFHKRRPDSLLYLHTSTGERGENAGVNLPELLRYLGLEDGKDYMFCDQYTNLLGFPDQHMAALYNAFDVHMLVSMGEGFGIPILEAQACGCPVIVGDWTSMGELCFSGWKIKKSEARQTWEPFFKSWRWQVNTEAVVDRLFKAYEMRGNQDYRKRARDGALAYDADRITEKYWKPVLAEIEEMLDASKSKMELFSKNSSISARTSSSATSISCSSEQQSSVDQSSVNDVKSVYSSISGSSSLSIKNSPYRQHKTFSM
jgi:glycosyltransferase involved in cell wall biosynthesis